MSLINDALKRARDAERNRAQGPAHPPLEPADSVHRAKPAVRWALLTVAAVALLLSMVSFWKWADRDHDSSFLHAQHTISPTATGNHLDAAYPSPLPGSPSIHPSHEGSLPQPDAAPPIPMAPDLFTAPGSTPPDDLAALPFVSEPAPISENRAENNVDPGILAPIETPVSQPELRLQSIIFRLRNPAVLINGEMLHVGDTISGGTITEIERHSVSIQWPDSNIVLQLPRL